MDFQSAAVELNKELNLKQIAEKVSALKFVKGANLLCGSMSGLNVFIFSNGRIRVTLPGGKFEELSTKLSKTGFQLGKLLEEVALAAGLEISVSEVISGLKQETESYENVRNLPLPELRKMLGGKVDYGLLRDVIFGGRQVLSDFQVHRSQTQVGETIGRWITRSEKPSDESQLLSQISAAAERLGLGVIEFEKKTASSGVGFEFIAKVSECFCIGSPVYGEPVCDLVRGLLRGAFSAFYGRENIVAEETKCWSAGYDVCEFNVRIISL